MQKTARRSVIRATFGYIRRNLLPHLSGRRFVARFTRRLKLERCLADPRPSAWAAEKHRSPLNKRTSWNAMKNMFLQARTIRVTILLYPPLPTLPRMTETVERSLAVHLGIIAWTTVIIMDGPSSLPFLSFHAYLASLLLRQVINASRTQN